MEILNLESYKAEIHRTLISKLDLEKLSRVNSSQARQAVSGLVKEIMSDQRVPLNFDEQEKIHAELLDEVFGLGPLEPLLQDNTISTVTRLLVVGGALFFLMPWMWRHLANYTLVTLSDFHGYLQ